MSIYYIRNSIIKCLFKMFDVVYIINIDNIVCTFLCCYTYLYSYIHFYIGILLTYMFYILYIYLVPTKTELNL